MLNNELWAATNVASLEFAEFCLHAAQCWIQRNELWRGPCSAYDKEFVRGWTNGTRVWSFTSPASGLRQGVLTYSLAGGSRAVLWFISESIELKSEFCVRPEYLRELSVCECGGGDMTVALFKVICIWKVFLHCSLSELRWHLSDIRKEWSRRQNYRDENQCVLFIFNTWIHYFFYSNK